MIRRYILHVEFHRGYWPKIKIWRKPRNGQRTTNGGEPGKLVACPTCSTEGFLFERDPKPGEHHWEGSVCKECEADTSWCDHPPADLKPVPASSNLMHNPTSMTFVQDNRSAEDVAIEYERKLREGRFE